MDRWASQMPSVAFICICCAEPSLAFAFRDRLQLKSCYNCFLGSEDSMPRWGQLGCNGFVILDSELRVFCPSTAAFLDVEGAAFRDVESKLRALLPDDSAVASVPDDDDDGDDDDDDDGDGDDDDDDDDDDYDDDDEKKLSSSGGTCASGRCSLPTHPGTSSSCCEKKTECICVVKLLGDIQPTGVAAMDEEHEECARALGELRDKRSLEALASVLHCLESHFAHEEQMLDESLYASSAPPSSAVGTKRKSVGGGDAMDEEEKGAKSAPDGFSVEAGARKSHYADHARMLRAIKGCLNDAQDAPGRPLVTDAFVDGLLRDFEAHASRYDDAYRVPAGAAALEAEAAAPEAEST